MMMENYKTKITVQVEKSILKNLVFKLKKKYKKNISFNTEKYLSTREKEVLNLITQGFNNKEIANKLGISKSTIKAHTSSILEKLCVKDRLQAAVKAIRKNLI